MSRRWFSQPLETVAMFWRILRRDGVALGFVTHDHDLWFDGVQHRAAPGMVPSSIRRTASQMADSAEVKGALSHDSISATDLGQGRFDGARVIAGVVDWQTRDHEVLYAGTMGSVSVESGQFSAELVSRKAELDRDTVPRTSPMCRAAFCAPGCGLSATRFTTETTVTVSDAASGSINPAMLAPLADFVGGVLRWLSGPSAGLTMGIADALEDVLLLDQPLPPGISPGTRVILRQGCDHRLETCANRFANAINFQGEPFLPGNDLVTRYPSPGN